MASGGVGGSLSSASDVQFNNPGNGEILKRNNGLWVNSPLAKNDVGLSNVDNTSDANKPVSTLQQTALNLKADTAAVPNIPVGAPRTTQTISAAFPAVTLAEVQAVNASATLSDTADWFVLQKFIKDQSALGARSIKIPPGTYNLSRGLDLSTLPIGCYLDGEGATLSATAVMPEMVLIRATTPAYTEAWHLRIHGLHIVGNYKAIQGLKIDGAQEWVLSSVRIYSCQIAIFMLDTWYGEISGLSVIQNCLVGLEFGIGAYSEINTIAVYNLKINFGTQKSYFGVANPESIGIKISSDIKAVSFIRVNMEGMDYGVKAVAGTPPGGYQGSIYTFNACYFEAIKVRFFDYSQDAAAGSGNTMRENIISIQGCRFNSGVVVPSYFSYGMTEILGNQPFAVEFRKSSNGLPVHGVIDRNVTLAQAYEADNSESLDTIIRRIAIPKTRDWARFAPWGTKTPDPYHDAMVSTIGHASWQLGAAPPRLRGQWANPSKYFPAYNIQSRPIVFNPGGVDDPNGPVVYGADNAWYMLRVDAVGAVNAKKILNVYRLDEHPGCRTAKELHYLAATLAIGSRVQCIDLNGTWLTLSASRRWEATGTGIIRIGTMSELLGVLSSLATNALVYDINTSQCSWKNATGPAFNRYTWWGESLSERTAGPLANRPATPTEGLIYYNMDDSTYSKYTSGAWAAFTPNNTA